MFAGMSMHNNCHSGKPVRQRLRGSGDARGRNDAHGRGDACGCGERGRRIARSVAVKVCAVDLMLVAVMCCCCVGLAGINSY